jgi:hypothetical protein
MQYRNERKKGIINELKINKFVEFMGVKWSAVEL